MRISIGNGSGEQWRPWLSMATGSPVLITDVIGGGIQMSMVNPSAFLTQAYRGVGFCKAPLPVRIVAMYPSYDRFVFLLHPKTGLKSLKDVKDRKYPLHVSVKEDMTHSTRVFIDQALAYYGFSLTDIVSWGGKLNLTGAPNDVRRMNALADGSLEAIFDEGLTTWLQPALAHGMQLVELEAGHFEQLATLGWRRVLLPRGKWGAPYDHPCIDYSGWPLYANANLPDDTAFQVAKAIAAREQQIVFEPEYTGLHEIFTETPSSPMDVPLHPGSAMFWAEHQAKIGG